MRVQLEIVLLSLILAGSMAGCGMFAKIGKSDLPGEPDQFRNEQDGRRLGDGTVLDTRVPGVDVESDNTAPSVSGCQLDVDIMEFGPCGCSEEIPANQCGWMAGGTQTVTVDVVVNCPEGVAVPAIERVVLNEIPPGGLPKTLLDVAMAPAPESGSYELLFDVLVTAEGACYFVGDTRSLLLEAVAWSVSSDSVPEMLKGVAVQKIWVDVNGPQLEVTKPSDSEQYYSQTIPWEFEAGDEGTGVAGIYFMLDWFLLEQLDSPEFPVEAQTFKGESPFSTLSDTTASFRIVAEDCLGNLSSVSVPVSLAASPSTGEVMELPCPYGTSSVYGLAVGEGDAQKSVPDLLVASGSGVLVSWGGGGFPLFGPLSKIIPDSSHKYIDAAFLNADGDAHPDIVGLRAAIGANMPAAVVLFRQNVEAGKGLRTYIQVEEWEVGHKPVSLDVCDLDGDGRVEVVVAHPDEEKSVALLFNTGKVPDSDATDTYLHLSSYLTGVSGTTDMKCRDISDDSAPDIVMSRGTEDLISVYLNLGEGQFGMALNSLLLDGDGMFFDVGGFFSWIAAPDLVVYLKGMGVAHSLRGNGKGYFMDLTSGEPGGDWKDFGQLNVSGIIGEEVDSAPGSGGGKVVAVGKSISSLVAADLDGDGQDDLALADSGSDQIQIYHGLNGGLFKEGSFIFTEGGPFALVARDFDNSGQEDLAFLLQDRCAVGVLLSRAEDTFGLPCSGQGQCPGVSDEGCECKCVCVCNGKGICGWKCEWHPVVNNCGPAPQCPAPLDSECDCSVDCNCSCSEDGKLLCPWLTEFDFSGNPTCTDYPGCYGTPEPACECKDLCLCGCNAIGAASCEPKSCYSNPEDVPGCEGTGQCDGPGICEGIGDCSEEVPDGSQCVCECGCECDCQCICYCSCTGKPHCYWDCKQNCDWECHVEHPQPYTPWSISKELPLPVKPDFQNGRLKPVKVAVGDLDVDGIPDIVVATETISKQHCEPWEDIKKHSARPLISFMGAGQTLTSVISHHSFSSRWMTSNLVGLEIGDFNGDPYPDLVMAVDRLATSEKSSSVNFDVMLGSQKWTNKFDRYACVNAQAPPGRFGTIGGFIYQGRPGALAVVPLNDDNLADLLIGASGMGDPGNSNYIPDQVAVLMTEEGSDWTSEVGAESTVFYEQCVPGLALNDPETTPKVCLDDSDCWSFCLPDEDQQVTTVGLGPRAAVFGDVDNDGVTDALVVFVTSGDVALLRGSLVGGKYNLSSPGKPPQKLSLGVDPTDLTLGDLDADGWLDLVAVVGGSLAVSWGVDGTNFQVPQLFEKSFGCSSLHATRVETGDVDNDGRDDVVVMSKANNALYVYSSTGDKQLVGPTIYKTAAGPVDFEVHDMNQDGCADFVVAVEGTRSVSVILSKACE